MFEDFVAGLYREPFEEPPSAKKDKQIANGMVTPPTPSFNTKASWSNLQSTVSVEIPHPSATIRKEYTKATAVASSKAQLSETEEQALLEAQFDRDGASFGIQVETASVTDDNVASNRSFETDEGRPPQGSDLNWQLVDDNRDYRILTFQSSHEKAHACTRREAITREGMISEQAPQSVKDKGRLMPPSRAELIPSPLGMRPLPTAEKIASAASEKNSIALAAKKLRTKHGAIITDPLSASCPQEESLRIHESSTIQEVTTSTTTVTSSDQVDDYVEDSDIEIIATRSGTGTRQVRTRFRTHTVLTIRSRSISESRVVAAPLHHLNATKGLPTTDQSHSPQQSQGQNKATVQAPATSCPSRFSLVKPKKRQPLQ